MSVHTDSLEEVCDERVIEDQHHMKAANKNKQKNTSRKHKSYITKQIIDKDQCEHECMYFHNITVSSKLGQCKRYFGEALKG